jgi:hypothetical protein
MSIVNLKCEQTLQVKALTVVAREVDHFENLCVDNITILKSTIKKEYEKAQTRPISRRYGKVSGSYGQGVEISGSIIFGEFLDQLSTFF